MKTNKFILSGYRINFRSYIDATKSIFMIHNETFNVWSHLVGAVIFIYFFYYTVLYMPPTSLKERSVQDLWSKPFDIGQLDSLTCQIEEGEFIHS